jgi:hypothetical protein
MMASTPKKLNKVEWKGMPEKAPKSIDAATVKRTLESRFLCSPQKTRLTIHRSTSTKELRGLKKIDSTEHKVRKIIMCNAKAAMDQKVSE